MPRSVYVRVERILYDNCHIFVRMNTFNFVNMKARAAKFDTNVSCYFAQTLLCVEYSHAFFCRPESYFCLYEHL